MKQAIKNKQRTPHKFKCSDDKRSSLHLIVRSVGWRSLIFPRSSYLVYAYCGGQPSVSTTVELAIAASSCSRSRLLTPSSTSSSSSSSSSSRPRGFSEARWDSGEAAGEATEEGDAGDAGEMGDGGDVGEAGDGGERGGEG